MTCAIVFDLDDTLIEESEFQESATSALRRYLESSGRSPELVSAAIHAADPPGSPHRFQQILVHLATSNVDITVEDLIRVHREHRPSLSFRPDVLPMLRMLQALDVRLGIITDGPAITQRNKLKAVDAGKYFESVVVTDELGPDRIHWKPDPEPFRIICRDLDTPPGDTIYVGDNPAKDFYISQALPITTVRLIREEGTHHNKPYLKGVTEHYSVTTLTEIPELMRRIGARDK